MLNNVQQCSKTCNRQAMPSSYVTLWSLLYTVVVSANEPHDLQWLEVCGSRRGEYLFLRTFEGGPMCRSWSQIESNWAKLSQIEPNLALASQRHGFVMICDDLWCALCNVHFWNVHFALHFESLNLSLFEEDPAAWPVERRQAWANCKPTGNVPAIIPQKVSSCKALSEAGIFDFWRRQCLWPLLHAARTRNMRNIHFLILPGVSLQELWLPMQLSSLHWGSSAWSAALHQRLLKLQKSNYFQDPSWMKLAN